MKNLKKATSLPQRVSETITDLPTLIGKIGLQQIKVLFESLPDDVRMNAKEIWCGAKYLPEEDRAILYCELIGK